jgi:protein TonB
MLEDTPLPAVTELGSPLGSETGIPEGSEWGMPGGVIGGIPGGVPGGVIGGVLGGTGHGALPVPVLDFDRPPAPLRMTRPVYPEQAFIKKVEGTVELRILIDCDGYVVDARVVRSIPLLDAAAIETVRQWRFRPAYRGGRPVAALARAPITFRIY